MLQTVREKCIHAGEREKVVEKMEALLTYILLWVFGWYLAKAFYSIWENRKVRAYRMPVRLITLSLAFSLLIGIISLYALLVLY